MLNISREEAKRCVGKGWSSLIDAIYDKLPEDVYILQIKEKCAAQQSVKADGEVDAEAFHSVIEMVNPNNPHWQPVTQTVLQPGDTMDYDKDYEVFEKWFSENEVRFAHAQLSDKQIAYSAWLAGRVAVEQNVQPTLLESEPIYNLHGEVVATGTIIFDKTQSR